MSKLKHVIYRLLHFTFKRVEMSVTMDNGGENSYQTCPECGRSTRNKPRKELVFSEVFFTVNRFILLNIEHQKFLLRVKVQVAVRLKSL